MRWWTYILLGMVWIAVVGAVLMISLEGAKNVVAADLAADPNKIQFVTAVVSALMFAGPGLFFILAGVRQVRRRS